MKTNQDQTRRPANHRAHLQVTLLKNSVADVSPLHLSLGEVRASLPRLLRIRSLWCAIPFWGVLALALWLGALPGLFAQAVPDQINYQGILLRGDGSPVPAVPTDVEFRIYDTPTLTTGLKWGRMFRITPDTNGVFNVVLSGDGALITGAPNVSLPSIFTGTGSDSRYLELTVQGSTPIRPRQRFVASPYAFLAHDVTAARQGFTVTGLLSVSGAANVGSLTTAGAVTAASFAGNGASLRNISAASLVQEVVDALCPVGTILPYAGDTAPSGWVLCNGIAYHTNGYPALFQVIGFRFGRYDDYTFCVPDLRGRFLRGMDGGIGRDLDATSRIAMFRGGATGDSVGSVQSDEVLRHNHNYSDTFKYLLKRGGQTINAGMDNTPSEPDIVQSQEIQPYGGSETRPKNAYVNFIIKY